MTIISNKNMDHNNPHTTIITLITIMIQLQVCIYIYIERERDVYIQCYNPVIVMTASEKLLLLHPEPLIPSEKGFRPAQPNDLSQNCVAATYLKV